MPDSQYSTANACFRAGKFHLIPFLYQTTTREEHPYITSSGELVNKTIALPEGTSIEEWIRRDYPNLNVITTEDEIEVFRLVERRTADMTLRSLMIAAYTIHMFSTCGWRLRIVIC